MRIQADGTIGESNTLGRPCTFCWVQPFHLLSNSVVKFQSQNHWTLCKPYMEKFLPLLGTTLDQTSTQYTASFVTNDLELEIMGITSKSRYVCAPNGVAGMGMVSTLSSFACHSFLLQSPGFCYLRISFCPFTYFTFS